MGEILKSEVSHGGMEGFQPRWIPAHLSTIQEFRFLFLDVERFLLGSLSLCLDHSYSFSFSNLRLRGTDGI